MTAVLLALALPAAARQNDDKPIRSMTTSSLSVVGDAGIDFRRVRASDDFGSWSFNETRFWSGVSTKLGGK